MSYPGLPTLAPFHRPFSPGVRAFRTSRKPGGASRKARLGCRANRGSPPLARSLCASTVAVSDPNRSQTEREPGEAPPALSKLPRRCLPSVSYLDLTGPGQFGLVEPDDGSWHLVSLPLNLGGSAKAAPAPPSDSVSANMAAMINKVMRLRIRFPFSHPPGACTFLPHSCFDRRYCLPKSTSFSFQPYFVATSLQHDRSPPHAQGGLTNLTGYSEILKAMCREN